ncbi:MAG: YqcI/YcgG family protein [Hydrogenovibrio sp.]|nr:YqcI/YcgG family protein [Hydrogenovibrio sp.]
MNLLKQFVIAQRRAHAFATEQHLQLNDEKTVELIDYLIEQVHQQGDWHDQHVKSLLSFVILQTAYRYYVLADRLLNHCQKPEMSKAYDKTQILPTLQQLAETLKFYHSVKLQNPIPENGLESVQDLTNRLFAMLAVNFPTQLKDFEAHWAGSLSELKPFARDEREYEPVFSPTHQQFLQAVDKTQCIFAPTGKYWGADEWDEALPFEQNIERFAQGFFRFMTFGKKEKFKGYALRFPAHYSDSVEQLSKTVARFLTALNRIDPAKSDCLQQDIEADGWKFSWAGETLFLTAFGTCYPLKHARNPYGFDYTYFFFQPDFVLRNHPGLTADKEQQSRERILQNFTRNDMAYSNEGKQKEVERYIRPMSADEPAVRWWHHL